MTYAIFKCINGNFSVHAEGFNDLSKARVSYFDLCKILWNADDVIKGVVKIVNDDLSLVESYQEYIFHDAPIEEPAEE